MRSGPSSHFLPACKNSTPTPTATWRLATFIWLSGAVLSWRRSNSVARAATACARCHGEESQSPLSNLVPVLHGQPATYLLDSLKAYAEGKRPSGIMQPLAADLRPEDMRELADYYANLPPPPIRPEASDAASVERGRKLAVEGLPDAGVPPCSVCHNSATTNPRLAGQHAAYMAGQLRLRKAELSASTKSAGVMMHIAQQLSDSDISDVASYFETLPGRDPLETLIDALSSALGH